MNQMSGECRPSFTPKQGQYLAFIDAYTRVHRRPPAERFSKLRRPIGATMGQPPPGHAPLLVGERPRHDLERSPRQELRKIVGSATVATIAVAPITPMPGM